ncbi:hypothetical protein ERJ75_001436200 [Trypanosoma vivax]|nr:hypothetical protein ERJ75_001436200 [Trypanosoma vivax]
MGRSCRPRIRVVGNWRCRYMRPAADVAGAGVDGEPPTKRQQAQALAKMRASRQTKAPHAPEMKIPGARRSAFRPITEAELDVAVRELSSGTGPGDDEIRCEALKQLGGAAKKRVRRLFNFSLRTGQVPAERWHDATRPLLKPKGRARSQTRCAN